VRLQKPKALKASDPVCVVAPAGPFERAAFDAGLDVLLSRYQITYDDGLFQQHRYLAGDDSRRSEELKAALTSSLGSAVFCARGGYGAMRLLTGLRFRDYAPKFLVGFSDITALHMAAQAAGWVSIHGPVLTQLGTQPAAVVSRLFHLLESEQPAAPLTGATTLVPGAAEGILVGGNLSVFTRLIGTPFMPRLEGALLLLEDVGERPYRLDRMWTHLRLAGVFKQVRGIALGDFTGCEEKGASYSARDVLRSLAEETGLPCAIGFPIGHGAINHPVPMGCLSRLDATAGKLEFLEAAASGEVS
jgi:muramoyltetrapeptide carboxypeptidase